MQEQQRVLRLLHGHRRVAHEREEYRPHIDVALPRPVEPEPRGDAVDQRLVEEKRRLIVQHAFECRAGLFRVSGFPASASSAVPAGRPPPATASDALSGSPASASSAVPALGRPVRPGKCVGQEPDRGSGTHPAEGVDGIAGQRRVGECTG